MSPRSKPRFAARLAAERIADRANLGNKSNETQTAAQLDVAARYAYLAARAYDYEMNFDESEKSMHKVSTGWQLRNVSTMSMRCRWWALVR